MKRGFVEGLAFGWVLEERKGLDRWWWEGRHLRQKGQHEQDSRCADVVGQQGSKVEHMFRAIVGDVLIGLPLEIRAPQPFSRHGTCRKQ